MPTPTKVRLNLTEIPDSVPLKATHYKTAFVVSFKPAGSRRFAGKPWSTWNWKDGNDSICVMYIPGRGFWKSNFGQQFLWVDPGATAKQAVWKRCELPVETTLPQHEYSAHFTLVKLLTLVSPDDANWQDKIAINVAGTLNGYKATQSFLAEGDQPIEWNINVPEIVMHSVENDGVLPINYVNQNGNFNSGMGGGFF